MKIALTSLFFSFLLWPISGQESPLIASGATLTQAGTGYSFTEGPAADAAGNVYFTDQPNNRIIKWKPDGSLSVFMEPAGRSNGLYIGPNDIILACADAENQLWQISPQKEVTILVTDYQGKKLNGPNDLWMDAHGGIYFTDPYYKRPYWTNPEPEIEEKRLYYRSAKGAVNIVDADFVRPNGLIGTSDGKTLYVTDIGDSKTYRYRVVGPGKLEDRTLFTAMGSDGMTLDEQGNVYLTGDGVTVFSPKGEQILHIPVPEKWTANITFGGVERKTLFITASKSVYTLEMAVQGAAPAWKP